MGNAGHHQRPAGGQFHAELLGPAAAISRGLPGPHHGDGCLFVKVEPPALQIEHRRRVGDLPQAHGIVRVLDGHHPHVQPVTLPQNDLRGIHALVRQAPFQIRGEPQFGDVPLVGVIHLLRGDEPLQQL